jgi:hypothetical protein
VDHKIGAKFHGLLIDGRSKSVIDNYKRSVTMGYGSQAGEIDNFDGWIRRALQVDGLAPLADCRFDGRVVGGMAERYLDSESLEEFDKQLVRSAVCILNRNHAIARRQKRKKRIANRGHAAGKTRGGFGRLETSYFLLEGSHRWIGVPAIDMTVRLALRHLQPLVHIVVAKRNAQGYWDLRGPLPTLAALSSPYSARSHTLEFAALLALLQRTSWLLVSVSRPDFDLCSVLHGFPDFVNFVIRHSNAAVSPILQPVCGSDRTVAIRKSVDKNGASWRNALLAGQRAIMLARI